MYHIYVSYLCIISMCHTMYSYLCIISMYHIYIWIISMYHIHVSYLCIISMHYIYVSYLCIISMYHLFLDGVDGGWSHCLSFALFLFLAPLISILCIGWAAGLDKIAVRKSRTAPLTTPRWHGAPHMGNALRSTPCLLERQGALAKIRFRNSFVHFVGVGSS